MNATPKQTQPASNKQSAVPSDPDPNGPLFFFKPNEEHGEFCQWYRATFTVSKAEMSTLIGHPVDEDDPAGWQLLFFNCAEQFMMYCKAGRFHDSETQKRILATNDPKEQKRLARLTKGFEAASWDKIKSEVVVAGNMAKFGQNQALRSLLLATGDRVLAEAASLDRVWGIGFTAEEARALNNQEGWGENRLGKALMEVRGRLRQEENMRVVGDDEVIWTDELGDGTTKSLDDLIRYRLSPG